MPTPRSPSKTLHPAGHPAAPSWFRAALATLASWAQRRRQRRALGALDPHLLRDVGLTEEEAKREAGKPFWR